MSFPMHVRLFGAAEFPVNDRQVVMSLPVCHGNVQAIYVAGLVVVEELQIALYRPVRVPALVVNYPRSE